MELSRSSYRYAADLFIRLLGGVYAIAFYSLSTQVHGLIGTGGILPAGEFFRQAGEVLGVGGWWRLPSLVWWWSGDAALMAFCWAGMVLGVLLLAGLVPLVASAMLWVLYLSMTVAGQTFFAFQWDNLLLEAGFLAILLARPSWRSRPSVNPEPSRLVIFLLHWLLFRLMFAAGYVKLASQDASWWDLTALTYHFWTQPLPTWTAWYFHQAPLWFLKTSTAIMFVIELVVPFLIFAGHRARTAAFALLMFLQVMIMGTGNYGFFNILTMVLCVPLLDDRWFSRAARDTPPPVDNWRKQPALVGFRWVASVVILAVSVPAFISMVKRDIVWPSPVQHLAAAAAPFRSINAYGLFAAMTKSRPEIIMEGSRDGINWTAYEFMYKPGDVHRTPLFVAPHMPRLDWQMWFAALGRFEHQPWLQRLMIAMMEGRPDVLDLLENNPFAEEPPRYMRALLYEYSFAGRRQLRREHQWWNRELKGLYSPVLARQP
ncbi:MAG TPA: lipase maturation factor family protein [Kiritimatiellia bacterium]|nr:lipase maturation factor family protein [Kiritimatiellia bacterium]HMO98439.1 lipase maturation factor family protein [Kiritimatiellia bacterium]HMP95857.1 lipase maturation factor family protein [Kiritimatiellia bacterium]